MPEKIFCKNELNSIPQNKISVDTPVPYFLNNILSNIKESGDAPEKIKIRERIRILQEDKRYSFMIQEDKNIKDNLGKNMEKLLRIPVKGKPLSIIDFSGIPFDVVDVVISVLSRMILDFAIWSPHPVQTPVVLVCEEAHRYIPRQDDAASRPTKKALARIAREGRKYGVGLGLVSQRPSELDESILSQCNTLIVLRMSNENDQNLVHRALPDSISNLVRALPTLRTQEALVVGEGAAVPMRLRFDDLDEEDRPQSADVKFTDLWRSGTEGEEYVADVVSNWRLQQRSQSEDTADEGEDI